MHRAKWATALVLAAAGLAACSTQAAARSVPPARVEHVGHSATPSVVLTPVGARRLALQTATATAAGGHSSMVVIPYSALLYQPDGTNTVYTVTGVRTYTRRNVVVSKITGNQVVLSGGVPAGTKVVTIGSVELQGVQDGVGVQT
jgi:multidrug efflux pump subunit AcrA (membrane-fusion protein)